MNILRLHHDDAHTWLSNALSEAISNNNVEQVRTCIDQGVDLSLENIFHSFDDGRDEDICPLAKACCLGHKEAMEELLKAGADPNQVSGTNREPVMLMPEEGIPLSMLQCLISYGADVNLTAHYGGDTLLHYLKWRKDENMIPVAKCLLDNGASFYARNHRLATPLYEACSTGNADLVKLFIAEGADVNVDNGLETLLTVAAESANIHLFDVLLNVGADRHLTAKALTTACRKNDYALITKILDNCHLDINIPFKKILVVTTILHYACDDHQINAGTVKKLLDHGADAKAVTVTGDTVMHYAVKFADCSKIRQLLSYNPHLNVKNNANQTILVKLITSPHGKWNHLQIPWLLAWTRATVPAFKMLVTAGAKVTTDVEREIHQLHSRCPETQISDYEISSRLSLKAMCRLIVRQSIPVPVDASMCKLPLPKQLQEYLNFPEFNLLVDEYLNMFASNSESVYQDL